MSKIIPISGREQWLRERKLLLTMSDIGAVVGVDEYRSALAVYADKMSLGLEGEDSEIMRRGRNSEPTNIAYLTEDHPELTFVRPNALYVDEEHRLGATPDCFAYDKEGKLINYQLKTVAKPRFDAWEGKLPLSFLYQTLGENMLVDADRGVVSVLVTSTYKFEIVEFPVPRRPEVEASLYEIARDFWENIANGVVPRPNYREDGELIAARYPPSKDVPVLDLSADNRIYALLEEREAVVAQIKVCEVRKEEIKNEIVDKLAGAEKAIANGWKISRTMTHKNEVLMPAVDFPSLKVFRTKETA